MILTYKDIVLLGFVAMLNVSLTNPAFISPQPLLETERVVKT